jgi:hypothetical protein
MRRVARDKFDRSAKIISHARIHALQTQAVQKIQRIREMSAQIDSLVSANCKLRSMAIEASDRAFEAERELAALKCTAMLFG